MFTFEDLLTVPETGVGELLGQMDKKTLATALRGASEELKNYIFKSMSSRAVEMLKEDMEVLGPVKSKENQQGSIGSGGDRAQTGGGRQALIETRRGTMSSSPSRAPVLPAANREPLEASPFPLQRGRGCARPAQLYAGGASGTGRERIGRRGA